MRRRTYLPLTLLVALVAALALTACGEGEPAQAPGTGPVTIRLEWRYGEGFPGSFSVHERLPGQRPGDTATYAAGEEPRIGAEIADGVIRSEFGALREFVAVYRNETEQTVRFWVAPHLPVPHEAERGLLIHCLCIGTAFEVPPGATWTRVMAAGLNRRAGTSGPVTLVHVVMPGDLAASSR